MWHYGVVKNADGTYSTCAACGGTGADRNNPRSLQGCAICDGNGEVLTQPEGERK